MSDTFDDGGSGGRGRMFEDADERETPRSMDMDRDFGPGSSDGKSDEAGDETLKPDAPTDLDREHWSSSDGKSDIDTSLGDYGSAPAAEEADGPNTEVVPGDIGPAGLGDVDVVVNELPETSSDAAAVDEMNEMATAMDDAAADMSATDESSYDDEHGHEAPDGLGSIPPIVDSDDVIEG